MSIARVVALVLVLSLLCVPGLVGAQNDPLFTIQADETLQAGLDALAAALYDGATLAYVDSGADLLVTSDAEVLDAATDLLPDYFLPDAGMVVVSDNAEAAKFVEFAVSPDGQQALIDAGLLPAVVTITDQTGNTMDIPQPVRGVITPHAIATYTVYGIGAGDLLLAGSFLGARDEPGISRMTEIDPSFPEKSSFSMSQREINVEEVALLAPDVILTSSRSQWLDAVAELNIPVVLFQGETPETLKEAVLITGQILGPNAEAHAKAWVAYYDRIFATVTEATASLDARPTVLVSGSDPLRVASGDMYQTSIVEAAGGVSVSSDLTGYWNDVNLEQVLVWNPDIILNVPYSGVSLDAITRSPEWQVVTAVANGKVFAMPSYVAPWDTPIPESVLGIVWLTNTLYPGLIPLDCATETDHFYRTFYNFELRGDEIAASCSQP